MNMPPLPFTWPLGVVFWLVFFWAMWPELRLLREARLAQRNAAAGLRDPSFTTLVNGQRLIMGLAIVVAIIGQRLSIQRHRLAVFIVGLALLIAASLLRRHCFRMLGSDFRAAVTVRADQPVVERGAYRFLRHPSYTGALLMHIGFALALTNWASLAIVLLGAPPLFVYRIRVEERSLVEQLGAAYADYMGRTSRLIPGLW
jgi:protein-S-isoprenylcysteine O-methyltransferase Ste14